MKEAHSCCTSIGSGCRHETSETGRLLCSNHGDSKSDDPKFRIANNGCMEGVDTQFRISNIWRRKELIPLVKRLGLCRNQNTAIWCLCP
jgi:hypothetical protein